MQFGVDSGGHLISGVPRLQALAVGRLLLLLLNRPREVVLVRVILHLHGELTDVRRNLQDNLFLVRIHEFLYLQLCLWGFVLKLDQGLELFAVLGVGLRLCGLILALGRVVGGGVQLSIDRLLFLDDPLVRSLLGLLCHTLGKIEFVLVRQNASIVLL